MSVHAFTATSGKGKEKKEISLVSRGRGGGDMHIVHYTNHIHLDISIHPGQMDSRASTYP
jgi:hypothetical protein